MIKEHQSVVLREDLPKEKLRKGDIGTIIHVHPGNVGYEVEFNTAEGEEIAIVSLRADQVRELSNLDVYSVRELVR